MTLIQLGEEHMFSAFLHDISERKQSEAALRQLPGEILRAQELERKRVARELHDSVGQFLTLVKIRIQSVEQMLVADHTAREATVKGGDKGTAIVERDPEKSPLYRRVAGLEKPAMPMRSILHSFPLLMGFNIFKPLFERGFFDFGLNRF